MQDMLTDAMEQLLDTHCTPAHIRTIESGGDSAALWEALQESGFVDALVGEAAGGSGLSLAEAFTIMFAAGRHALPLPLAQTLLVRGVCAAADITCPTSPIAIAGAVEHRSDGGITCSGVPFGRVSAWIVADCGDGTALLLPASAARVIPAGGNGSVNADLDWPARPAEAVELPAATPWNAIGACATAVLLAGALERVFDITIEYANTRTQFGKPIGKLQAIQHQLSVMAESVFAAKMAAQIGCADAALVPAAERSAVAKARTSAAVPGVAAISHAVHGAMGFTEEYDLQLYTRRLHEWRAAYGAESYWHQQLGAAFLSTGATRALDFVRTRIMAAG